MNNFLSIVWYRVLPPQYGGQKGIAEFNQQLGTKIPLTCLCSNDNQPVKTLSYTVLNELPASRLQFWNPNTRKQILALVKKHSFSHIIIEHPYHGWLGKFKEQLGFRFIVHAHNIEHLRMKARGKVWWRTVKTLEEKAFAAADHILFKTESDKNRAISIFNVDPSKCLVISFGLERNHSPTIAPGTKDQLRKKYGIASKEKILLFAGTLDYEPNIKALEILTDIIIPILQRKNFPFRLVICGALPEKKMAALNDIDELVAAGYVPSLEEYLQAADVFVNPVSTGSGIQTKNFDAIANGCNVVSTQFAASGLPSYLLKEKLWVSADNDWEDFANNITIASNTTRPVPPKFYEDYSWKNIIDRFLKEIEA